MFLGVSYTECEDFTDTCKLGCGNSIDRSDRRAGMLNVYLGHRSELLTILGNKEYLCNSK